MEYADRCKIRMTVNWSFTDPKGRDPLVVRTDRRGNLAFGFVKLSRAGTMCPAHHRE